MKLGACGLIVLGVASLATAQTADAPRVEGNVTVAPFAWPSWGGRATVVAAGVEVKFVRDFSLVQDFVKRTGAHVKAKVVL